MRVQAGQTLERSVHPLWEQESVKRLFDRESLRWRSLYDTGDSARWAIFQKLAVQRAQRRMKLAIPGPLYVHRKPMSCGLLTEANFTVEQSMTARKYSLFPHYNSYLAKKC